MVSQHKNRTRRDSPLQVDLLFRIILGAVFLWAGITKIADPHNFATVISNYHLLPDLVVNSVAVGLPWVEVLCGLMLICGIWIDGSLVVINTLLILFMAALVSNWIRGIDVDCGCFSTAANEGESNYLLDLVRDAVLLGVGLRLFYSRARFHRLQNPAVVRREN